MRNCGLALLWFSLSTKKQLCGNCDKRCWAAWKKILWHLWQRLFSFAWKYTEKSLSLMDKKISNSSTSLVTTATGRTIGLVAIVTREIERFEKNLVAFVTTTFQLCLKIYWKVIVANGQKNFKLLNISCHKCHKKNNWACGKCDKRFWLVWKKSCGSCDNDFLALPENISQGLVAIVTRDFERFEKNLVAVVTTTFQLCLKIFQKDLWQLWQEILKRSRKCLWQLWQWLFRLG